MGARPIGPVRGVPTTMRIACVQYAPELGRVAQNAERVRALTASYVLLLMSG